MSTAYASHATLGPINAVTVHQRLLEALNSVLLRACLTDVGIEDVCNEAGIDPDTILPRFSAPEDFYIWILREEDTAFRRAMRAQVDETPCPNEEKLLATFDHLIEWFDDLHFFGCPFINIMGNIRDRDNPIYLEAVRHKSQMVAYFEDLARFGRYARPSVIAEEINLLHEGAIAVAQLTGSNHAALRGKKMAARLLANSEMAVERRQAKIARKK